MSYICLQSEKEDGTLNSSINEDIIFPKDSKCALVNLNMELIESVLNITENVKVIISLHSSNVVSFNFQQKNYTNLSYWDVLQDLATQANNAILASSTTLGFQIKFTETEKKIEMDVTSCPYYFDKDDWAFEPTLIEYDDTNDVLGALTDVDLTTNMSQMYIGNHGFNRGAGTFRVQINEMNIAANTGNFGFILALVKKDIISLQNPITLSDLTFAISLPFQTNNYNYQHNGAWHTKFNTAPASVVNGGANNDVVELLLDRGNIYYNVHQANGVKHQLFVKSLVDAGINSSQENRLYPIIIFGHDKTEVSLSKIRCTFDPNRIDLDDVNSVDDSASFGTVSTLIIPDDVLYPLMRNIKLQIIDYSNVYSKSLSRFLGFPYKYHETFTDLENIQHITKYICETPLKSYSQSAFVESNFIFRPTFFSKMFFIEFTSQNLESFNSITGGQKNILLPIALHNQYEHHIISYEPENLYFVDLHNVNDVLVRNYQFRILDENMKQVKTNGKSTITIVVQKK